MSAARTKGAVRRGDAASRRSRAGRTFVALLGVSSIALTAAAAQPLGPRDATRPGDVFALGEGGLGAIDMLTLEEGDGADASGRSTGAAGGSGGGAGSGSGSDLGLGFGFGFDDDPAVEVPVLGEESFASFVPSGIGGLGGGAGIPAATLRAYRAAAEVLAREAPGCGIDWALLAGIGRVEANHGRFGGATVSEQGVSVPRILGPRLDGSLANTQVIRDSDGGTLDGDAAYDRAVGPMQFLPGTWKRWGSDGDRDGVANPQDVDDAALAAARYLCQGRSGLADPAQAALAVRRYNNSSAYVDLVLATAAGYRSGTGLSVGFDPFGGAFDSEQGGADEYGDLLGWSPFMSLVPPGWTLPPGTVVGGGPGTPAPSVAPSVVPSAAPSMAPSSPPSTPAGPTVALDPPPTGPPTPPSGSPTTPPPIGPTEQPTEQPTGSATSSPSDPSLEPSQDPTTVSPAPMEPGCDPTPSADPGATPSADPVATPSTEPGDTPTLAPCPPTCGTTSPSTVPEPEPSSSPTCLPVASGEPSP